MVYTSWLSRAIETAWMVINELEDSLWVPIVKSWRLNERMYGALTGLSKKMIRWVGGLSGICGSKIYLFQNCLLPLCSH